jgi:MFS family permease
MLFSQLVLVQRMGFSPQTLLRIGLPLAGLAFAGLAVAASFAWLVTAMTLFGLGMGLAAPGYAAGATLRVEAHEQGSIAGLISAAPGLGFVMGPLLGAWLYAIGPSFPYWAAACVYAVLVIWLWRQKDEV